MKRLLLLSALIMTGQAFAQFSQSFEGGTTPAGWTVIAGGDANTWYINDFSNFYDPDLQAQNGAKCYSIDYGSTAHNDFLVTPQFNVVAGVTDKLTFWGRSRDVFYPEVISVKASTSTATASAFTTVLAANIAPLSGTTFYKYTIDLTSLVGQNIYVGFHSTTTDKFVFDIDNVVVGTIATCIEPTSPLDFSNVTTNSLTLGWSPATPSPAQGYEIYYSTSTTPPTNATEGLLAVGPGVVTTPVTGLAPGTRYYFYVRSKCSSTSSSVWGHLGVRVTNFTPTAAPYAYGFDNLSTYIADGWTGNWSTTDSSGLSQAGTHLVYSNNSQSGPTNTWLFSRPIILQANSINTIKFYLATFNGNVNQSIKLTVAGSTIPSEHTNIVWTSSTVNNNTGWIEFTATYTPSVTGTYYFGFNHFSPQQSTPIILALDSFSISSALSDREFSNAKFTVSPNPVKDLLKIANEFQTIQAIEIFDLNGRQVRSINSHTTELQVSLADLSSGVYLLKILTVHGISTQKIIKE